jgi:hypothetical protein
MSYVDIYVPPGLMGLGADAAEQRAKNRQLNETAGVSDVMVGPGFWDDFVDAAIAPSGISSVDAARVPAAIREVLEAAGSHVDKVCWGGGEGCGGEGTRGKIYVKWKAGRPYNAVTYADIARNLFASAADQFAAGSRLVMYRYRIPGAVLAPLRGGFLNDKYVYPEGGPIPASAPETARRTTVDTPPLESPPGDLTIIEHDLSGGGLAPAAWVALGIGGTVALGVGYFYYRGRSVRRNRRRRSSRRTR